MRRTLLDTSAYSAFMRGHAGIQRKIQEASILLLNPVVLGELRAGFLGGSRREENLAELTEFLSSSRTRIVAVDEETATCYSVIVRSLQGRGRPIPTNDLWIAASAMQHGARVLTTDAHFRWVQQIVADVLEP